MSDLYEEVCAWYNLYMAWLGAARGKRGREPAARFEYHLEDNLLQLQEELQGKTYRPGPYDSFYIHEPKRRLISAAPFRDRVVHHALCNVIGPPFERRFIADSYANRIGKGTHRALDRCQGFARRYRYVLQCDVRQFFPSIDHGVLEGILGRVIGDPDVMGLVERILESGVGARSTMKGGTCGAPPATGTTRTTATGTTVFGWWRPTTFEMAGNARWGAGSVPTLPRRGEKDGVARSWPRPERKRGAGRIWPG
jgi:hypothetical protein